MNPLDVWRKTVSGKGYREYKSPEVGLPFSCSTNCEEAGMSSVNGEKEKRERGSQKDGNGLHDMGPSRTLILMLNEMGNHWSLFNRQMIQSDLHF